MGVVHDILNITKGMFLGTFAQINAFALMEDLTFLKSNMKDCVGNMLWPQLELGFKPGNVVSDRLIRRRRCCYRSFLPQAQIVHEQKLN